MMNQMLNDRNLLPVGNDGQMTAGPACRCGEAGGQNCAWNMPQSGWPVGNAGGMSGMGDRNGRPGRGDMPGGQGWVGNVPAASPAAPPPVSSAEEGGMRMLDLSTGLSADALENPATVEEARLGSLRSMLMKIVGHYVVVSFLIGTEAAVSWEGFLYSVGNDYIVIFQPDIGRYVTGDLYSLKFVEFYNEKGTVPSCSGSRRRDAYGHW